MRLKQKPNSLSIKSSAPVLAIWWCTLCTINWSSFKEIKLLNCIQTEILVEIEYGVESRKMIRLGEPLTTGKG